MIRFAAAVALGLATLPGLAVTACAAGSQPSDMMPDGSSSSAPKGPDPAYFMPADPHLSLEDVARVQALAPGKDVSGLGFEQVAAIENALLHPALADQRPALISQALDPSL